mgnify:CR=1 FL=1
MPRTLAIVVFLAFASFPLASRSQPQNGQRVPSLRPFPPNVFLHHPRSDCLVVCDECVDGKKNLPAWVYRLGMALQSMGFSVRLSKQMPSQETLKNYVAILSGLKQNTACQPDSEPPCLSFVPPLEDSAIQKLVADLTKVLSFDPHAPKPQVFAIVVDDESATGRSLFVQIAWVVQYAKLSTHFVTPNDFAQIPDLYLDSYSAIVLATDRIPDGVVRKVKRAAEKGIGIASLTDMGDETILGLFGIKKEKREKVKVTTIECDETFLPGAKGLKMKYDEEWNLQVSLLELDKDVQVLCIGKDASARSVPIVLRYRGNRIYWNAGILGDKSARGRILLTMLDSASPSAGAIMGAFLFFVDDCPMPMWGKKLPPLETLYDMDDAQFYFDIWLPRVSSIFSRYQIKPTFAFVLSYDDRTAPPFSSGFAPATPEGDVEPVQQKALAFARKIFNEGYEVGLHGYNHQSLVVSKSSESAGWLAFDFIVEALSFTRQEMARIFGSDFVPKVYIAPNNLLHTIGKQALALVFPEIKVFSTQYLDERAILGQEFFEDPDIKGVMDVPRISSECFLDEENAHEILDALLCPGVFSHFIHPDDILDPSRSRGLDFEHMALELERLIHVVHTNYPFLARMTASEFGRFLRSFHKARLEVSKGEKSLVIRVSDPPEGGLMVLVRDPFGGDVQSTCEVLFKSSAERRLYVKVGEKPCIIKWP